MNKNLIALFFCCIFLQFSYAQTIQDSLLLYYTFDGNANNGSPLTNVDAVVNGAVLTTDKNGFSNSAYAFDGVNDYLSIPHHADYKVQYPVSIAGWVYTPDSSNANQTATIFANNDLSSVYYGFAVAMTPSGKLDVSFGTGGGAGAQFRRSATSTNSVYNNTWTHFVAVVNGPTNMKIYINGVEETVIYSGTGGATVVYDGAAAIIGSRGNPFGAAAYFNGSIDAIGFWKRALSPADVAQLYNSLTIGLLLHYDFNNNTTNTGLLTNTDAMLNGTMPVNGVDGMTNGAYSFNGTSDWMSIPLNNGYKVQYPITVSTWVYTADSSNNNQNIILFSNNDISSVYYGISLGMGPDGTVNINYGTGGGSGVQFRRSATSTSKVFNNEWTHLTAIIEGPTDMRIYFNGVADVTTLSGSGGSTIVYDGDSATIGTRGNPFGAQTYFNGTLDEIRFWNRALAPSEILGNYNELTVVTAISMLGNTPRFKMNVFPNPTNDKLFLETDLIDYMVELYDMTGKQVRHFQNTNCISLSDLQNGFYFLKVLDAETKKSQVFKVVKQQ